MLYFIQGVFFQNQQWLGTGMRPAEGIVAVVRSDLCQFMYSGIIHSDPDLFSDELEGEMHDTFGHSTLSDVVITETEFRFSKMYERGKKPIQYVFNHREGNVWVGEYSSPVVGNGVTSCILNKVREEFFTPESIAKLLGRNNAHTPATKAKS